MNPTHLGVDGHHLTLCGHCTCTDKSLAFAGEEERPTCSDCLEAQERILKSIVLDPVLTQRRYNP